MMFFAIFSVYSISTFLNATRAASEAFVVNVSQFIEVNDRIINEIDILIAGLSDIHSRINRVHTLYSDKKNTH